MTDRCGLQKHDAGVGVHKKCARVQETYVKQVALHNYENTTTRETTLRIRVYTNMRRNRLIAVVEEATINNATLCTHHLLCCAFNPSTV